MGDFKSFRKKARGFDADVILDGLRELEPQKSDSDLIRDSMVYYANLKGVPVEAEA